jgi:hypothetical protein
MTVNRWIDQSSLGPATSSGKSFLLGRLPQSKNPKAHTLVASCRESQLLLPSPSDPIRSGHGYITDITIVGGEVG